MSPLLPWVTCFNFLIRVTQSQEVKAKGRSCLVVCLLGGWGLAGESGAYETQYHHYHIQALLVFFSQFPGGNLHRVARSQAAAL